MTGLGEVVFDVAQTLPGGQRDKLVAVLRGGDGPGPLTKQQALAVAAGPDFAVMVGRLFRRWHKQPEVSAAGLALAIEAAGRACDRDRDRSIRPVWTGPDAGQPVRLTASVMAEVIDSAQRELLVISFAAYKIPQVLARLEAAAHRGVVVDIVLETAEDSGGALSFDQLPAFAALDGVRVWHWPADKRPEAGGSLHAKAIVADDVIALVTSANLTQYALANNIELGLLARDSAAASGITAHIAGLMRQGFLARFDA
jgi:phosphatidylserine/phosphatidylglycerophosphate/cardiolipin synthase-like enzyme